MEGGTAGRGGVVKAHMSETDASYEVCILVGSRWEIHARYPVTGAALAIEEAKQLEHSTKSAVKVLREIYDKESGLYKQVTVYKGAHVAPKADSPAVKARRYRSAGRPGHAKDGDDLDDLDDLFGVEGVAPPRRRRGLGSSSCRKRPGRPLPGSPSRSRWPACSSASPPLS